MEGKIMKKELHWHQKLVSLPSIRRAYITEKKNARCCEMSEENSTRVD
jgi:hypothetical protein